MMRNISAIVALVALMLLLASCQEKQTDQPKGAVAKDQTQQKPPAQVSPQPAPKEEATPKEEEKPKPAPVPEQAGPVRPSAVAGQWYPDDPKALTEEVDKLLDSVAQEPTQGQIIGLISPHAGYKYSAPVAAFSYYQIKGKHYDTVVLIGPGHRGTPGLVSVYPAGAYGTPLGKVPVNGALAAKIMMDHPDLIKYQEWVDSPEWSLEAQLPFLQRVLKDFRIVPILMTECSKQECETVAKSIAEACRGENVLLVASTELSHRQTYEDATRLDRETMQTWQTLDPDKILAREKMMEESNAYNPDCAACGHDAIVTMMMAAKLLGANAVRLLKYANSGDTSGDRSRIVGYGAAVVYKDEAPKKSEAPTPAPLAPKPDVKKEEKKESAPAPGASAPTRGALSPELRKKLLALARSVVEAAVKQQPIPAVQLTDAPLQEHRGAFVTIKNRHRADRGMEPLRGCIGNFISEKPLYRLVEEMAYAAATQDSRFFGDQVTPEELKEIDIEISVLSPLTPIADPMKIELGKQGIYIINDKVGARGVFLPQVATETGWSKEEFLSHCARDKAGLPADSWKNDPDTKVLVFTAEVFGEKE